jgi:hypothetical protein
MFTKFRTYIYVSLRTFFDRKVREQLTVIVAAHEAEVKRIVAKREWQRAMEMFEDAGLAFDSVSIIDRMMDGDSDVEVLESELAQECLKVRVV